uniref:Isopenicillin N synthase-like Fe(2+) 2OG dioxygenase domain-containing protein n=2 Tax=Tetraselmis sp. GSL018 TaxID=582737 RepID=A0A061QNU1_9CHLO|eukprot:CAMPEP_0177619660 /NCGR_PEP_ID=MMETSP0419_2-20121207/26405_1 /TAXON_ID=582737 /ORGANISM="Tetraselmis sp., Strain GSL018" /LENGTH=401 /DNA_ID=CAMNT_0019118995 /DNA_START=107 /DNA_END=1312 /DNA_ORIENTATION=+
MDSVFQINYLELLEEKSNEHAHMSKKISAAFGSQGPGFLIVTHVPGVTDIRSALFAATARAAKLSDRDLRLLRSESALGSDISSRGVPPQQRRVTTFSRQIEVPESSTLRESYRPDFASSGLSLGEALHELASIIFRVGLLLLDLCDSCFSSGGVLGKAVKECGSAKARLVHYHKEGPPRKKGKAPKAELWQDWHCDYGLLTGLAAPAYHEERGSGAAPHEPLPPDALLFQVGEAAEILSGGRLRATPHCVARPLPGRLFDRADESLEAEGGPCGCDVSRQNCVVFLQPHWSLPLVSPPTTGRSHGSRQKAEGFEAREEGCTWESRPFKRFGDDRQKLESQEADALSAREGLRVHSPAEHGFLPPPAVPALEGRWYPMQQFGAFSKSTVRAYYANEDAHGR